MIMALTTMSGKTTCVKELMMNSQALLDPPPTRIIWLCKRWQSDNTPVLAFIQGLPHDLQTDAFINPHDRTLIVIDDLMKGVTRDTEIYELFTEFKCNLLDAESL